MKQLIFTLLCLLSFSLSYSQTIYHKAKISLENKDIADLAKLGLEVDHGHLALGRFIENDFSEYEIEIIKNAGFDVEIIIENVQTYYADQLAEDLDKLNTEDCFGDEEYSIYDTPTNFTLGTMGGFYTYQELLDILDDMQAKFPSLISVKKQIGDIVTHENRPIYSVVISDNPEISEDEPKTLYTAIHHAREPNALTQMVFYMWHLLENYETDPLVSTLINEVEMHFIPVVNPDGYSFNVEMNPGGGGLWRKNRRDNEDGTFGVDLNRNYGFQWGINDIGSSPETQSQVYRGPSAFSEPETQAVKLYCETHPFNFNLNYHTSGNLLIYPWGYNDAPTPESPYFEALAIELTKINNYKYGSGIETVGYNVNGDSDDWMYGEEGTKDKIYAMTPEVGTEGFWPPVSRIIPNSQANVQANLSLAAFNLNYPTISTDSPIFTSATEGLITYEVNQLGLESEGFTVTAEAISDNVFITENTSYNLVNLEKQQKTVSFQIDSETALGEEVVFVFKTDAQIPLGADTVRFIYLENGVTEAIVEETFGNGNFWVADNESWFYDDSDFVSPSVSFSESKDSNYEGNESKEVTSNSVILPESERLILSFDLKVDIEEGYDFTVLYIIPNGQNPIPLCGKYSSQGSQFQLPENPVYDGTFGWVREEIDITEWKGMDVTFKLTFNSDGFLSADGIYIDDWSIMAINKFVGTNDAQFAKTLRVYPNPAQDEIMVDLPYNRIDKLLIMNSIGQQIGSGLTKQNRINITDIQKGIYYIIILAEDGTTYRSTFIKQ